jgi:putative transposase
MLLSYKYRIDPNRLQSAALGEMLSDFCRLYNAGLEQRIDAWRRRRVSVSYKMQADELKAVRSAVPEFKRWSFSAEQQVLRRLDKTFRAFFVSRNGFPRFRSRSRFHAADFLVGDGMTIRKSGKLGIVGIPGEIKVRWHRDLPSKPKSAILTRQCGKWYVVLRVEVAAVERASPDSVGIDFGLTNLMALSCGETIARPNWTKRTERETRRRQRAIARCKRGSSARRKRVMANARLQASVAARRRDFCHKLTRVLVERFGRIALEELSVIGLAQGMHAKHVHDAAWTRITSMLVYKAANAGGQVIKVDPRGTSQTCPECGAVAAKALAMREHRCSCGCVLDRDVAAAMVIHFRAFGFWPGAGLGSLSQPVAA